MNTISFSLSIGILSGQLGKSESCSAEDALCSMLKFRVPKESTVLRVCSASPPVLGQDLHRHVVNGRDKLLASLNS